ncbi:alpha-ketoglutarate-dependent dioxygenase alkB homolog 7, mitochondrial-like [Montipora capricornis]|uniref:alpha-ketoglutarate-dependent dioxygenase alkB homolog 7, mitochondrial-like n=1 Tax=Montipora capricornis TaxID=246305 RepID=UPI0035F1357E
MADTRVLNFCKSLFSSRFSAIHVKSFRYFTRYLSSKASDFRVERDRVSFITEGCSIEELEKVQDLVVGNLEICEEFVSEEEEGLLLKEVEPYLKRQKYQYDHWDDAIHGYRETEKSRWSQESLSIFQRIRDVSFGPELELLPHVHVLDLDKAGYIKPHIDSIKFCGDIISGVSLLSPSIMRFKHEKFCNVKVDALLRPRSLYVIRNAVRYEFSHEILSEDESVWKGEVIPRGRRISLILRCQPSQS